MHYYKYQYSVMVVIQNFNDYEKSIFKQFRLRHNNQVVYSYTDRRLLSGNNVPFYQHHSVEHNTRHGAASIAQNDDS